VQLGREVVKASKQTPPTTGGAAQVAAVVAPAEAVASSAQGAVSSGTSASLAGIALPTRASTLQTRAATGERRAFVPSRTANASEAALRNSSHEAMRPSSVAAVARHMQGQLQPEIGTAEAPLMQRLGLAMDRHLDWHLLAFFVGLFVCGMAMAFLCFNYLPPRVRLDPPEAPPQAIFSNAAEQSFILQEDEDEQPSVMRYDTSEWGDIARGVSQQDKSRKSAVLAFLDGITEEDGQTEEEEEGMQREDSGEGRWKRDFPMDEPEK